MLNRTEMDELIQKAKNARCHAYAPYSGFSVGAALLTKSGLCYTGANIENASFTPTVCAERVAFFGALHAGERDFSAIAIVGGNRDGEITEYCPPLRRMPTDYGRILSRRFFDFAFKRSGNQSLYS